MIHERFDIEHWIQVFPLDQIREAIRSGSGTKQWDDAELDWGLITVGYTPNCGTLIVGPYRVAIIEQLRREQVQVQPDKPQLPTDIFVFGRGEAPRREMTKIGGLPYWPASRPWPCAESGAPLTFVAQLCFADSRDIVRELPGDILLIFAELAYLTKEESLRWRGVEVTAPDIRAATPAGSTFHFEWLSLGETDLVKADNAPRTDWQIMPCYGQIHRTYDCDFRPEEPFDGVELNFDLDYEEDDSGIWSFNATKISGVPHEIQWDVRLYSNAPYLATLGEIVPQRGIPYPFINVADMLEPRHASQFEGPEEHALRWGDCGLMYLYVREDGEVHHHIDGH